MAVFHGAWRFELNEVATALAGLRTLEDVLAPSVTSRVRSVGADPERRKLLVAARLDPTDQRAWAATLEATRDDFGRERSAADRLSVLLAGGCEEVGGLAATPPTFVEALLDAAGWSVEQIGLCLRGMPISGLFAVVAPALSTVVSQCCDWLVGGWLDRETALTLLTQLDTGAASVATALKAVVPGLAGRSWLSEVEVGSQLETGLTDLRAMLGLVDPGKGLWIIQD